MAASLFERRPEDLKSRVQWLLFFRLAIALVGLVLVLVLQGGGTRVYAPYAVLVAACVLDLGYLLVATLSAWLAQELRRVKILYSEILEKMAEGLVAIDRTGRIVFVNGEARRLLHYRRARSLVGLDFRDVFRRREDRAVLDCLLSQ